MVGRSSFCSEQWLRKSHNWLKSWEKMDSWCSVLNGVSILSSYPRLRECPKRGSRKKESQRVRKSVFWTSHLWTHQASQHFNVDDEGAHKNPPLPEELLAVDDYWVRERQFFFPASMVCGRLPMPLWKPPIPIHSGSTIKDLMSYNNNQGQEGDKGRHVVRGPGRRSGSG